MTSTIAAKNAANNPKKRRMNAAPPNEKAIVTQIGTECDAPKRFAGAEKYPHQ
jgi:hypothetical protein